MSCAVLIIGVAAFLSGTAFLWHRHRKLLHEKRIGLISELYPEVESAFTEISTFYNYSHYITETERIDLDNKYEDLRLRVEQIIASKELEESSHKDCFLRFFSALTDSRSNKTTNNEHFVENQLRNCAQYFDTVLAYPLDQQQREAVVSLEDNVLVISSAGSGKTMTTVGKVRYLIDVQKVSPEKILLITFTRKAAESLSERLGEKKLKCRTFHKLALDIISEVTGVKPTITDQGFPAQVYHTLFQNDDSFREAIADYIVRARYKMKDQFEYTSRQEYMQDRQKYGIQAYFKDMDGHPVFCKSDEESQICDFLGSRGIKFRYEEKYEFKTVDSSYRQYCPDFSIYIDDAAGGKPKRIYLEHFAINENDRCPSWFGPEEEEKYKAGIAWKRKLHEERGTILLETTSGGFHRGDVFEVLSKQLTNLGIVFSYFGKQGFSRELARQEQSILDMLTAFNYLMKGREIDMQSICRKAYLTRDSFVVNDIIKPFVETYRQMEDERMEIDFTDAILRATDLCNNGHRPDYDYILVDEFQDISLDRYHFLQSLRRESPLTKLFCVGDDWQSIYRFAGSDMALFKHFEEYFGYTKKCLMETTYRFGEPAIDKSSNFILANPGQAVKQVHSFKSDAETQLDFVAVHDRSGIVEAVKRIADTIPLDKEILLLGRYSFDVGVFNNSDLTIHESGDRVYVTYGQRQMVFLTVHQSKGLESDYVILLNCNGGTMGFPADIADSPVLRYVLCEPDEYSFGEERRLFYVAITRAKKQTWVLYDPKNPSPFIGEFIPINLPNKERIQDIPESERCPKCRCGRVYVGKKGIAVNGNPYSVLFCSNEKYGCDYRETVFVNLNKYHRSSQNTDTTF